MNHLLKTKQPASFINQTLSQKHERTKKVSYAIAGLDNETSAM